MLFQSKKVLPWSKKNYVATIFHFFVHAIVLSLLLVGFIAIDYSDFGGVEHFFSQTMMLTNYVYTVVFIFLICLSIYVYLYAEFRDFLMKGKNIALIFVITEICLIIYLTMGKYINVYARPAALFALLILLLINKRCALFLNFIFCLMLFIADIFLNASLGENEATAELVINACSSIIAIYLVDGIGSRIKVFFMGFAVAVPIILFDKHGIFKYREHTFNIALRSYRRGNFGCYNDGAFAHIRVGVQYAYRLQTFRNNRP